MKPVYGLYTLTVVAVSSVYTGARLGFGSGLLWTAVVIALGVLTGRYTKKNR